MSLSLWFVDPHDTLIFRDGKPFNATPGAIAQTRSFPFPATIAGGVRSLAGLNEEGIFDVSGMHPNLDEVGSIEQHAAHVETDLDKLKQLTVRGPFLVRIPPDKHKLTSQDWYFSAPGDALLLQPSDEILNAIRTQEESTGINTSYFTLQQLQPLQWPAGFMTNTPSTALAHTDVATAQADQRQDMVTTQLWLVGQTKSELQKPVSNAPRFWLWERFKAWLIQPDIMAQQTSSDPLAKTELGIDGPEEEERVHVSINHETRTGHDQMLFGTHNLRFINIPSPGNIAEPGSLASAQRLGLAVVVGKGPTMHVQEDTQATKQQENIYEARLHEQFSYLGGERRIVSWRQAELALPECPDEVIERVLAERYCRLILLTPGIFDKGYYPTRLLQPRAAGVSLTLKACKVAPPDSISGWDIDKRSPKASRRLAPAGSVYFVKLHGASQQEIKSWLEQTWFSSISDQDQDQLDGFGVVALGTWSGAAMTPEEQTR